MTHFVSKQQQHVQILSPNKHYSHCYSKVKMPNFEAWKVIKLQLRHSKPITFNNNIHSFI
jgi:hypothetical protein